MIKQIDIDRIPPYLGGNQTINPKKINFLFGLNGSGKTTISRFIRSYQEDKYRDCCKLTWSGDPIECCVYNTDYVADNFCESSVAGIFTLGEENIEIKRQIETLNEKINQLRTKKEDLNTKLNGNDTTKGLQKQLEEHEVTYSERFWAIKQQLDQERSSILEALVGVRGSKEVFKNKLLEQHRSNNAELKEKSELERLCTTMFGKALERINLLAEISFNELIKLETKPILSRIVVGKEDVDIAALIKTLGNDAWFRQGVPYLDRSEGKCPFCQEPLKTDFRQKVEEYFDESYINAIEEINSLSREYTRVSQMIVSNVDTLKNVSPDFIKQEDLAAILLRLNNKIAENNKKLNQKKAEPNISIQLESVSTEANDIKSIIDAANAAIAIHNTRVANIKTEKEKLTSQAWRYVLNALTSDIETYWKIQKDLNTSIEQVKKDISEIESEERTKRQELREKEQMQTSIIPTADGINALLANYGFTGFSLKVTEDQKSYQFVRDDGTPAFKSLSEGERNFVTFLYFMHSLKGNTDDSGHNNNKVVVVDDPVSSLDNDILFIVSSLLRDLFADIYAEKGTIKQLFILSHNIYFFKEVSYKKGIAKDKTAFGMIVKSNNVTKITEYDSNPISSTYEMLWKEIKRANASPNEANTITLANVMRRIIEYYFSFLGGKDLTLFHREFPEGERQVFKSLISWAHAGSHSEFDDYSATPHIYTSETYLKVFKDLFIKANHESHYDMMMEQK